MVGELLALAIPDGEGSLLVVDDNSPDGTGAVADELVEAHPERVSVLRRTRWSLR